MNIIQKQIWRYREEEFEKYQSLLLDGRIRLSQVPAWLLQNEEYTKILHIYAFRCDRQVSRQRYMEDLEFLEYEILRAKFELKSEALLRSLESSRNWAADIKESLDAKAKAPGHPGVLTMDGLISWNI